MTTTTDDGDNKHSTIKKVKSGGRGEGHHCRRQAVKATMWGSEEGREATMTIEGGYATSLLRR